MAAPKTENGGVPLKLVRGIARAFKRDNWQNTLTGLGTARDKLRSWAHFPNARLDDETLENLYHDDDMAAIIVDRLPMDMLRMGLPNIVVTEQEDGKTAAGGEQDISADMSNKLDELGTLDKMLCGLIWGRLYGGAAIFLGAEDGQDALEPLNEDRIKSFDWMSVLDKRDLVPMKWYNDPTHPKFGEPMTYIIQPTGITPGQMVGIEVRQIHESRLILFEGVLTSNRRKKDNNGWAFSVLQRVYDTLQVFNSNWLSVSHLMTDASQGVFKVKGLIDMIAGGERDTLQTRMEVVDMGRSVARALMIDSEDEDFQRIATTFQGLPDLVDKSAIRLAAGARMPVTILFGQSPSGMDATGESDIRWWYDDVRVKQEQVLKPKLMRLITLLFKTKSGPTKGVEPEQWDLEFESLFQLTELELAELREKQANVDTQYINAQVLLPEEVAINRFGPDGSSNETVIDLDVRKKVLTEDIKAMLEPKPEPPEGGLPGQEKDPDPDVGTPGSDDEEDTDEDEDDTKEREDAGHVHTVTIDGQEMRTSGGGGENHTHSIRLGDEGRAIVLVSSEANDTGGHVHTFTHKDETHTTSTELEA